MYLDCLNDIIGLTKADEACLSLTAGVSKSDLWIDDTSAGNLPLKQAFWGDYGKLDRLIPDAVKEAVKQLRIETDKRLTKKFMQFFSTIGFKDTYTGNYSESASGFRYMRLKPKNIIGGLVTIKGFDIFLKNGKYAGNVKIIQNEVEKFDDVIGVFEPITLNFKDGDIYIVYPAEALNPPRNFVHTGCCGKTPTYSGYVSVDSGISTAENLLTNILNFQSTNECQGIELKANFDCDGFQFLCDLDFERSTFGIVFAKLVQQIARLNIGYYILSSDKVTAYSMVKDEEIRAIIEYLTGDIEKMVKYLPENYDHSDCYRCTGVYRGEIII